jgi:hypothetical protein
MQNSPSKFNEMVERHHLSHPWARVLTDDNFEMIDRVALRHQLKLLKGVHAKQLILEGLLVPTQQTESKNSYSGSSITQLLKDWTDDPSIKSQPSKIHMSKAQYDITKKFADSEAAKQKLKANLQKAAR